MNIWMQLLIAALVYFAVSLGLGLKGHRLKMRMKQFGNGMIWVGAVVLLLYMILLGAMLSIKVAILTQEFLLEYRFETDTALLLRGLPFAFVIMIFVVAAWFTKKAFSFNPIKVNDKEKELIKGENAVVLSKIRKVFGLKVKEKEKKV